MQSHFIVRSFVLGAPFLIGAFACRFFAAAEELIIILFFFFWLLLLNVLLTEKNQSNKSFQNKKQKK
jgi:hypothetical protein